MTVYYGVIQKTIHITNECKTLSSSTYNSNYRKENTLEKRQVWRYQRG